MKALIIIGAVFLAVYVAMLIVTKHAMPYDPSWDDDQPSVNYGSTKQGR